MTKDTFHINELTTITALHIDGHIIDQNQWRPVSEIPSTGTKGAAALDEEYSKAGVYQVAMASDIVEIGDNVIHPKIGYTGMSENIHSRTYDIRNSASSDTNVKHGCGRYIRQSGLDPDQVMIRILYVPPKGLLMDENPNGVGAKQLEDMIHAASVQTFGNRFAWKEASSGNAGRVPDMVDTIKALSIEDLFNMRDNVVEVLKEKLYVEADTNR